MSAELIAEFEKESLSGELEDPKIEAVTEPEKEIEKVVETDEVKEVEESKIENQNEYSSSHNGPAVKKLLKEHELNPADIVSSGKGGRITKADVINHLDLPSVAILQVDVIQHSTNHVAVNPSARF